MNVCVALPVMFRVKEPVFQKPASPGLGGVTPQVVPLWMGPVATAVWEPLAFVTIVMDWVVLSTPSLTESATVVVPDCREEIVMVREEPPPAKARVEEELEQLPLTASEAAGVCSSLTVKGIVAVPVPEGTD